MKIIIILASCFYFVILYTSMLYCEEERPSPYKTFKATDNTHQDFLPSCSNDLLVWHSCEKDADYIIIKGKNGKTKKIIAPLSKKTKQELIVPAQAYGPVVPSLLGFRPEIFGNLIAFAFYDGHDYEIAIYDGAKTELITDNDDDDNYPVFWQDGVVWAGWDGEDYELFFHKDGKTKQLTNNAYNDYAPASDGKTLVWNYYCKTPIHRWKIKYLKNIDDKPAFLVLMQDGKEIIERHKERTEPVVEGDSIIYFSNYCDWFWLRGHDGKKVFNIDTRYRRNGDVRLKNGRVVWKAFNANNMNYNVYCWDESFRTKGKNERGRRGRRGYHVNSSKSHQCYPVIAGDGTIYWQGFDGQDYEIFCARRK